MHLKKTIEKVQSIFVPKQEKGLRAEADGAKNEEPHGEASVSGDEEKLTPEMEDEPDNDLNTLTDSDWENRTLCSDESCIGVIGPDGRCKECGKPFGGD